MRELYGPSLKGLADILPAFMPLVRRNEIAVAMVNLVRTQAINESACLLSAYALDEREADRKDGESRVMPKAACIEDCARRLLWHAKEEL